MKIFRFELIALVIAGGAGAAATAQKSVEGPLAIRRQPCPET